MKTAFWAVSPILFCALSMSGQTEKSVAAPDRAARMNEIVTAHAKDNGFIGSVLVIDTDTVAA